jgi:dTMP kinase
LIAFEGVDGAGKSTVIHAVAEHLKAKGTSVFMPRMGKEHDSQPARLIRRMTRDSGNYMLSARAELALYCAREAQVLDELVRPALARGDTVLIDRSLLTPVVLGCYGRGIDRDEGEAMAHASAGGLEPDMTLVFDVHPRTSRIRKRIERARNHTTEPGGRKGLMGSALKERVRAGYLALSRERGYPVFHVERITPAALSQRVVAVIEHGRAALQQDASDAQPVWMVDPRMTLADSLEQLPPSVALFMANGLRAGRAMRARLLEQEPALCSWSMDAEDPLRERALELDPIHALSGLSRKPLETDDLRLRCIDRAPAAALSSLRHVSGGDADAVRLAWAEREPSAVIESLAGREDSFATDLRAGLWKQADFRSRGLSLVGCRGEDAAQRREQVFARDPVLGAITLRGVTTEQGDYWLRQLAPHAAKVVLRSLTGRADNVAYELREQLFETGREVIDSLRGLDDLRAWTLRERGLERWPSTVADSLLGLSDSPTRRRTRAQCAEIGAGDLHVLRRLCRLDEYAALPGWARAAATLGQEE